jgi:hypothetical protein
VAVGNRLYLFESMSAKGGLYCMTTDDSDRDESPWSSWRSFLGSSRCFWSYNGATPAFEVVDIRAHAVHPRGNAIYLSFLDNYSGDAGTYEFDTASSVWTRVGNWRLPFKGHAGYDGKLEAWVGLHAGYDGELEAWEGEGTDGHLCACRVPLGRRPPEWKVGREKMLLEDPGWRRVDVKLVHMGQRAEYCIVERLRRRQGADEEECLRDGEECLLCVTTFRVEYGDDGELVVATANRRERSYRVSRYHKDFEAQAFWI